MRRPTPSGAAGLELWCLLLLAVSASAQETSLIGTSVKSDKWNIKRGDHKVEEFTGNVVYQKDGRKLNADWALYDHDRRHLESRGNLRAAELLEDGTTAVVRGERAVHDQGTGLGRMDGKTPRDGVLLHLMRPDGSEQGQGRADRASWNMKARTVRLDGSVRVTEHRGQAQAQTARFLQGAKRLELEGRRPVLTGVGPGWGAAVQADIVTAEALDGPRRRITGTGRAHGWLHFPQKGPFVP